MYMIDTRLWKSQICVWCELYVDVVINILYLPVWKHDDTTWHDPVLLSSFLHLPSSPSSCPPPLCSFHLPSFSFDIFFFKGLRLYLHATHTHTNTFKHMKQHFSLSAPTSRRLSNHLFMWVDANTHIYIPISSGFTHTSLTHKHTESYFFLSHSHTHTDVKHSAAQSHSPSLE